MLNIRRFVSFESRLAIGVDNLSYNTCKREISNYWPLGLASLTGGSVKLTFDRDVARVTLDHVEKHNSLSGQMMLDFREVIIELENLRNLKAVVLTGAGKKAFCAGSDLNCIAEFTKPEEGFVMILYFSLSLSKVHKCVGLCRKLRVIRVVTFRSSRI